MYPRNAESPEPIAIGPVVQISDGAVQTAGVTVRIKPIGVAEADGGGTTAYSTDGVVLYTPTQAETNYTSFVLIAKKTNCIPASVTVVTSASNTTGYTGTDQSKILNPTSTVNLSGTTIKNTSDNASQASVDTLASYVDTEVAAIKAKTDNLPVDPADASDIAGSFATVNATLASISGYIDTEIAAIKAKTDNLPAQPAAVSDVPTANSIASAVAAITAISRLDSMIESDGAGQFRFDTIAVSMIAGGGGTDWTANERTAIRAILGVPTSGTTPTDPTSGILDTIRDKTNLISTGTIQSALPVTASGQIEIPLIIGDDYLAANGRNFLWTVPLPTGFSIGSCTCRFGMENSGGTGEGFIVTGTVSDAGGGNASLSFDVPRATSSSLSQGLYDFSVELVSSGGNEVTQVASDDRRPVLWRKKQT